MPKYTDDKGRSITSEMDLSPDQIGKAFQALYGSGRTWPSKLDYDPAGSPEPFLEKALSPVEKGMEYLQKPAQAVAEFGEEAFGDPRAVGRAMTLPFQLLLAPSEKLAENEELRNRFPQLTAGMRALPRMAAEAAQDPVNLLMAAPFLNAGKAGMAAGRVGAAMGTMASGLGFAGAEQAKAAGAHPSDVAEMQIMAALGIPMAALAQVGVRDAKGKGKAPKAPPGESYAGYSPGEESQMRQWRKALAQERDPSTPPQQPVGRFAQEQARPDAVDTMLEEARLGRQVGRPPENVVAENLSVEGLIPDFEPAQYARPIGPGMAYGSRFEGPVLQSFIETWTAKGVRPEIVEAGGHIFKIMADNLYKRTGFDIFERFDDFEALGSPMDLSPERAGVVKATTPDVERVRGVTFIKAGRAAIKAFDNARPDTMMHELMHAFERFLPGEDRAALLGWGKEAVGLYKQKNPKEAVARAFEEYLRTGITPVTLPLQAKNAFIMLKNSIAQFYKSASHLILPKLEKHPEVKATFDRLMIEPVERFQEVATDPAAGLDTLLQEDMPRGARKRDSEISRLQSEKDLLTRALEMSKPPAGPVRGRPKHPGLPTPETAIGHRPRIDENAALQERLATLQAARDLSQDITQRPPAAPMQGPSQPIAEPTPPAVVKDRTLTAPMAARRKAMVIAEELEAKSKQPKEAVARAGRLEQYAAQARAKKARGEKLTPSEELILKQFDEGPALQEDPPEGPQKRPLDFNTGRAEMTRKALQKHKVGAKLTDTEVNLIKDWIAAQEMARPKPPGDDPPAMQEDEPIDPRLFSATAKTLKDPKLAGKMRMKDWFSFLSRRPGVKGEELEYSGFQEAVKEFPEKKETKEDVSQFFHGMREGIREKAYGGPESKGLTLVEETQLLKLQEKIQKLAPELDKKWAAFNRRPSYDPTAPSTRFKLERQQMALTRLRGAAQKLENKRTAVSKTAARWPSQISPFPKAEGYGERVVFRPPMDTKPWRKLTQDESYKHFGNWPSDEENTGWLNEQTGQISGNVEPPIQTFGSHAFPEPNTLFWNRQDLRTTTQGEKVFFLQESQSDLHQKGRDTGYRTPELTKAKARYHEIQRQLGELNKSGRPKAFSEGEPLRQERDALVAKHGDMIALEYEYGVPDAPFKGARWGALSLKRALLDAVDSGAEGLAWTTGRTQQIRARKDLDYVDYWREPSGKLEARYGAGQGRIRSGRLTDPEIAEMLGRPLYEQMQRGEGEPVSLYSEASGVARRLTGENLSIGGEGMNLHYNKVLLQAANEIGKPFGVKVGEREIPHQWRPEGRISNLEELSPGPAPTEKVHYLPITPEMRKALQDEGLPLYQEDPVPNEGTAKKAIGLMKQGGDLLRAGIAGTPPVAAVNLTSLHRMMFKEWLTSPVRATSSLLEAQAMKAMGAPKEAARLERAAKMHLNTLRSLPANYFPAWTDALLDGLHLFSKEPRKGGFSDILDLAGKTAGKRHAEKVRVMSTAEEIDPNTRTKRAMMVLNIVGDRMGNRAMLGAAVDNLKKSYGVKSVEELGRLAESDPNVAGEMHQFMLEAVYEAQKVTWNNPWTKSDLAAIAQRWGNLPVVGLLTNPFAKATFANAFANMMETIPVLHLGSRRVRDSYSLALKRVQREKMLQGWHPEADLKKLNREIKGLEETGVYSVSAIHGRLASSAAVAALFSTWREMKGNDGTAADHAPLEKDAKGKVTMIGRLTAMLGEDMPAAIIGDMWGWKKLRDKDPSLPNPYEGKEGKSNWPALIQQSVYGSKYGLNNISTDLLATFLSGRAIDDDYMKELLRRQVADVGRMAASGGPLGGTARLLAEVNDPKERVTRRADEPEGEGLTEQLPAAFRKGLQSQIPGLRQSLPPSPDWVTGQARVRLEPGTSLMGDLKKAEELWGKGETLSALTAALPGVSRQSLRPLERFLAQYPHKVRYGDVLPSQSDNPAFDMAYAKHYAAQLEKSKLVDQQSSSRVAFLPEEVRLNLFLMQARKVRATAFYLAQREYKKTFGDLPKELRDAFLEREEKTDRERELKRKRLYRPNPRRRPIEPAQ